ncbi:MAG: transposase [Myxococcales bacterium]|nr:transposase [Myxococcales bacterium]
MIHVQPGSPSQLRNYMFTDSLSSADSIDTLPVCEYPLVMAAASKSKSRARVRHVQQALFRRGGKRKGAGRPPKGKRAGTTHEERPEIDARYPLHVVLRLVPEVGSMRRHEMYEAVREASVVGAVRERIRIVHISVQATHLHLLVEADSKLALSRGMQGFQVSVARRINTLLGTDAFRRRRGRVFADRYFVVEIRSPRQACNVLAYILGNWRKHGEDRSFESKKWLVDPFSSGISFPDWLEREGHDWMWRIPDDHDPLVVYRPQTWLLREGWKKSGKTISVHEVPGAMR